MYSLDSTNCCLARYIVAFTVYLLEGVNSMSISSFVHLDYFFTCLKYRSHPHVLYRLFVFLSIPHRFQYMFMSQTQRTLYDTQLSSGFSYGLMGCSCSGRFLVPWLIRQRKDRLRLHNFVYLFILRVVTVRQRIYSEARKLLMQLRLQ